MGGSSPLARGTRFAGVAHNVPVRFIPAGAGNTRWPTPASTGFPVHPRWRGEHASATWVLSTRAGSSPLARGTPEFPFALHHHWRFIPAGAGNTTPWRCRYRPRSVHPRWRGEHRIAARIAAAMAGSSPLARGTHLTGADEVAQARFIPAGAGNTPFATSRVYRWTVHPRWRGEHTIGAEQNPNLIGSSPLARGTRVQAQVQDVYWRFIPAGAGNTR